MNYFKKCAVFCSCLLLLGGCSLFSGSAENGAATPATPVAAAKDTPAAAAPSAKESDIKAALDKAAATLVGRASRTVVPSKANPKIAKSGKGYTATYVDVDTNSIFTSMSPGQTKATPYVGVIQYQETTKQCYGSTKAAAKTSTDCKDIKSRNVKELIRYDGKSWQF